MFRIGGGEGAWRLIVPLVVKNANGKKIRTHALLDGGSTRHVVAKSICEKLGIVGEAVKMRVTTLDRVVESERLMADVDVEGVNGVALKLNGAIFGNIIAAEDDAPPKDDDIAGMDHPASHVFLLANQAERRRRRRQSASSSAPNTPASG